MSGWILCNVFEARGLQKDGRAVIKRSVPEALFAGREEIIRRYPKQEGCKFARVGQILTVKEPWAIDRQGRVMFMGERNDSAWVNGNRWKPAMHLPSDMCRFVVRVVDVEVRPAVGGEGYDWHISVVTVEDGRD